MFLYFVTELFAGVILLLVERISKWVVDYRYNMMPVLIVQSPHVVLKIVIRIPKIPQDAVAVMA